MEKWKERKEVMEFLNDRGWTYHGMSAYARNTRTSVLDRNWQKHISDKCGLRYDMPPYVRRHYGRWLFAAVPKPLSPSQWHEWTRLEDKMKKSGWDRTSLRVCGSTPKREPPIDLQA